MRPSQARQLEGMESLYRELLLAALRKCADGRWGLFGSHDLIIERQYGGKPPHFLQEPAVEELLELGSQIEQLRSKLGPEPFALHARLLQMRAPRDANSPGEPKLAKAWLEQLEADIE